LIYRKRGGKLLGDIEKRTGTSQSVSKLTGGTKLTAEYAKKHGMPFLKVQLDEQPTPETVTQWLERNAIIVLIVAVPRESKFSQDVYQQSILLFRDVLIMTPE
jgi:hypothetical protein